eukprot:COSAG03_NODE_2_length_28887_cov_60.449825_20_plen_102_part_00
MRQVCENVRNKKPCVDEARDVCVNRLIYSREGRQLQGIPRQSSSVTTAHELHRCVFFVCVIDSKPDSARARGLKRPVRRVCPPHIRWDAQTHCQQLENRQE